MPSTLPILLENGKRNGETESKNGTEAVTELGKEYIELSIYIFGGNVKSTKERTRRREERSRGRTLDDRFLLDQTARGEIKGRKGNRSKVFGPRRR